MEGKPKRTKEATSMRLSADAKRLLALMADRQGVPMSYVLEAAIREKARREKVTLPKEGGD